MTSQKFQNQLLEVLANNVSSHHAERILREHSKGNLSEKEAYDSLQALTAERDLVAGV